MSVIPTEAGQACAKPAANQLPVEIKPLSGGDRCTNIGSLVQRL